MAKFIMVPLEVEELTVLVQGYKTLYENASEREQSLGIQAEKARQVFMKMQIASQGAIGKPYYQLFLQVERQLMMEAHLAWCARKEAYEDRCKYSDLYKSYQMRLDYAKYHGPQIAIEVHE